ncbi:hypothetical protein [Chryseobacterium paridis]|uniref:Uncharacterized protein n=1 Tax=Chryseobacterium paridis TaxID=2800328 RepID=A0ABS1FXV5_9FLAO|nr:hypothetical protein [Chryseobacterium paridis]MBK1897280.1 hypothetical protein [Chryseobacterium paridis]
MPQNIPSGSLSTSPDSKGLNVRPDLLPESFFFLEKGQTFNQDANGKFGANGTVFRTTSKVSFTGKVYTICQGQVFLQPCGSDSTKVNAILKPFNQPIKGLAIKYIVYRGLNRSDFFQGDLITSATPTGFVDVIKKEFTGLYNMLGITVPPFTAQHIGYPVGNSQLETDLIDDYFLKISKVQTTGTTTTEVEPKKAFELPMIPRGTHLGNATGSIGIDIVLNEGDYTVANDPNPFQLNLAFARTPDHILDQSTGTTAFKKKLIRETATQFLDIAAFYGLHAQGKGKIYMSDNSVLQTVEQIASQISGFATAETTYLYIQGSRQRSYNFYGNQNLEGSTNNIRIGTTVNNMSSYQFESGWPVREFNGYPSLVIQPTTDNYSGAGMYVKMGKLLSENQNYFVRNSNLLQAPSSSNDLNYTKPILFDIIKTSTQKSVSGIIQIIYEGKELNVEEDIVPSDPALPIEVRKLILKDIDDVFGMINVKSKLKINPYELDYVIDQNLLLIDFNNKTGGKDVATITTKRVTDIIVKNETESLQRVSYETLLNNIYQNTGSFFQSRTAYLDNSNSGTVSYNKERNNYYQPEQPYYLKTEVFTDNKLNTITGLSLHIENENLPSKKLLGISSDENDILINLTTQAQLNNPKFFFKNLLANEDTTYSSLENIKYKKYSLSVIGEDQTGKLKLVSPSSNNSIYVTTIDDLIYSSDKYARWIPRPDDNYSNLKRNDLTT